MFFKSKIMIFMIFDGFEGSRPVSSADVDDPCSQVHCTENRSKTVFQRSRVPGDSSNRLGIDFLKFEIFIFFELKIRIFMIFHDFQGSRPIWADGFGRSLGTVSSGCEACRDPPRSADASVCL